MPLDVCLAAILQLKCQALSATRHARVRKRGLVRQYSQWVRAETEGQRLCTRDHAVDSDGVEHGDFLVVFFLPFDRRRNIVLQRALEENSRGKVTCSNLFTGPRWRHERVLRGKGKHVSQAVTVVTEVLLQGHAEERLRGGGYGHLVRLALLLEIAQDDFLFWLRERVGDIAHSRLVLSDTVPLRRRRQQLEALQCLIVGLAEVSVQLLREG